MRALVTGIALSLACLLVSAAFTGAGAQIALTAINCETDDEVAAADRTYEKSAMAFVEAFASEHPDSAYASLIDELRAKLSKDQFVKMADQGIRGQEPFTDLHVEHSYRVIQKSIGSASGFATCTLIAHGSLNSFGGRVVVATRPVPLQAHVILEGQSKSHDHWAFTIWLTPSAAGWDIDAFDVRLIAMRSHTAQDLWDVARREERGSRMLNAFILYATAAQLSYRGPNLQYGIATAISQELKEVHAPKELEGKGPYEWKFGDDTYSVSRVGPVVVGTAFDLNITYQVAQTEADTNLEQRNHALIAEFEIAHPEYAQAFDGLAVVAVRPDGTGYRTSDPTLAAH